MIDTINPFRKCPMTVFLILILAAKICHQAHTKTITLANEEDIIVSVVDGTHLKVKCNYSGPFDNINFQWIKIKNHTRDVSSPADILNKSQWLNLENLIFYKDKGLYSCLINGSNGNKTFSEKRGFFLMTTPSSDNNDEKKTPIFIKIFKDNILLLENSTLRLNCPFFGDSNTEYSWYKNDRLLIKRKAFIDNYALIENDYSSKSVKLSDAGNYTCKVNNTMGLIQQNFTVIVYEDGKKIPKDYLEFPISLSLKTGETAIFYCEAFVYHDTHSFNMKWYYLNGTNPMDIDIQTVNISKFNEMETKYGVEVLGSKLILDHVSIDDEGWYICTAYGNQKILMAEAKLEVDKIAVRVNIPFATTNINVDSNLTILCSVDGLPTPNVTWYKNGQSLRYSDRIQATETKLTISNTTTSDSGSYKCEAYNSFSSDEQTVYITVKSISVSGNDAFDKNVILSITLGLVIISALLVCILIHLLINQRKNDKKLQELMVINATLLATEKTPNSVKQKITETSESLVDDNAELMELSSERKTHIL